MGVMISVAEAEAIINQHITDYGTELVPFEQAPGRVLAEELYADRDLPPCDRVTMDGIAIRHTAYAAGIRTFRIKGTIAAGAVPGEIDRDDECLEIMTGAALPASVDTVVRYEDLQIINGTATITTEQVKNAQNVHHKGRDKRRGAIVATGNQVIDATVVSMAASVGKSVLQVKKLPKVVVISTGNELVDVHEQPEAWQIRSSNNYTIKAVLQPYGILCDLLHIQDDKQSATEQLGKCLEQYDVVLLTGGVSMGKYDYVPQVLEVLQVTKLFHKIQQRPGKPFWFGRHHNSTVVFAFPGNPVSTFLCLHRYFLPWLEMCIGLTPKPATYAVLNKDVTFAPPLQYFMQVKVTVSDKGQLIAMPAEGNGSGDFANLLDTNAFMELPMEETNFVQGSSHRIWPFKPIL